MFSRHVGVTFLLALLCAVVRGNGATIPELNDPEGQVVGLEYFFDQDPGEGIGIPVDFSANEQGGIELNLDLPLDGLSAGMHQLFIRAQNGRNEWSIASKHTFYLTTFATQAPPVIEKGEFFIGEDPGEGKGIPVSPTEPTEGAVAFSVQVSPMSAGHHTLQFRAQDSFGNWSMPAKNNFLQLPDIRATGIEWSVVEGEEVIASGAQAIEPPASRYSGNVMTPLLADASINERSLQAQARLILEERIPSVIQTFDLQIQAVGDPLRIITPPQNQTVSVGGQLRLSLVVNQSENLSFQWFKDGVAVPGATSSSFTIPVIGLEDTGSYSVSISDGVQEVLSDAAMVQVSGPVENAPPTITLIGDALLELSQGATYTEPGVSATDPEDGDLSDQVVIEGQVNTSVPGTYLLKYSVNDQAGLSATATRTVQVISLPVTNTPPTITLAGETTMLIDLGSVFVEPGFIASDEDDGDLTNVVAISGMVVTSSPGTYTLEYTVTDAGGLTTAMIREVIVRTPSNVPNGMVLIEDLGPVGIGNDKDNLSLQSIDSFYMDIHEVTKGLWDEVRGWGLENGYPDLSEGTAGHEGDASHPVTEISWYDMVKWCNARSEMEGMRPVYFYQDGIFTRVYREGERLDLEIDASSGYRLPAEVEWEKAARGDQYANEEKTQGFDFPWGSNERTPQDANYGADGDHTTPVGSYPPNAYGLYDMSGNVWERCWDASGWWQGENAPLHRVMRGGSWVNLAGKIYSSFINGLRVSDKENFVGFRTVLPPGSHGSSAEHPPIHLTLMLPSADMPFYRLRWDSQVGASYYIESVNDMGETWALAEPQPVTATSDTTEWVVEVAGQSKFFRVRSGDFGGDGGGIAPLRVALEPSPRDGAFAIPKLAPISVELPNPQLIDPDSIQITIGSLGTFDLNHPAMSYEQGTLMFDTSMAGALGDFESIVSAQVVYSESQGERYEYSWSFRLQKETILNGEVFVLGSNEAQSQGQALNPRQKLVYDQVVPASSSFVPLQNTGNSPWMLEEVLEDSLVFSYEGDIPPSFQKGQFLANLTPTRLEESFYREVIEVEDDVPEDGKITVTTKFAGWVKIFEQVSILANPSVSKLLEITKDGLLVDASTTYELGGEVTEEWKSTDTTFTLNGNWKLTPTVRLAVDIQGFQVEDFFFRQAGVFETSVNAAVATLGPELDYKKDTKDPIFEKDHLLFIGFAGPVPVWVDVEFALNAEVGMNVTSVASLATGISKKETYWSEIVYSQRNPSLNGLFAPPPQTELTYVPLTFELSGEANAYAKLIPQLDVRLDSLFGVYANITPEVGLNGQAKFVNAELESASFDLYGKIELNAGLSLFGKDPDELPKLEPIELASITWFEKKLDTRLAIITQPQDQIVHEGSQVVLEVEVTSDIGVEYQWWNRNGPLEGETGPSLIIENYSENTDFGSYFVRLTKGDQKLDSAKAFLSSVQLELSEQPEDRIVKPGANSSIYVYAESEVPITYKWYRDGVLIAESDRENLRIENASRDLHSGEYYVRLESGGQVIETDSFKILVHELEDGARAIPLLTQSGTMELDYGDFDYIGNFGIGGVPLSTRPLPTPDWRLFDDPASLGDERPSSWFREQPPDIYFDNIFGVRRNFVSGNHAASFFPVVVANLHLQVLPGVNITGIIAEVEFGSPQGSGKPLHPDAVWWAASSTAGAYLRSSEFAGFRERGSSTAELFYSVAGGTTYEFRNPSNHPWARSVGETTRVYWSVGPFDQPESMEIGVGGYGSYTAGFRPENYSDILNSEEFTEWMVETVHKFPFTMTVYVEVAPKELTQENLDRPDSWYSAQLGGVVTPP